MPNSRLALWQLVGIVVGAVVAGVAMFVLGTESGVAGLIAGGTGILVGQIVAIRIGLQVDAKANR